MKYSKILWDWNGTLLDDAALCINTMNKLLRASGLGPLTPQHYAEIFRFPVYDYYCDLGFDWNFMPFESVSTQFITAYEAGRHDCTLRKAAAETIVAINEMGLEQAVLSAAKEDYLVDAIDNHGLHGCFASVAGAADHHARGKIETGNRLLAKLGWKRSQIIMIGDTDHDAEVAASLNIHCLLIPSGHQSPQRLMASGATIIDSLDEIFQYLTL